MLAMPAFQISAPARRLGCRIEQQGDHDIVVIYAIDEHRAPSAAFHLEADLAVNGCGALILGAHPQMDPRQRIPTGRFQAALDQALSDATTAPFGQRAHA
jgi:hypothetical protein